jgi:alkaline phosphatase D
VYQTSGSSDPQRDYTATIDLAALQPNTHYAYDVQCAGQPVLQQPHLRFKTLPTTGTATRFQVAFGGGAGFTPEYERMWDTIGARQPDALFLLGDNVYIDLAEEPRGLHQYTYYRRQSRPEFRRLVGATPVYAIWDDHDCGIDDVWMGPYLDKPSWKPAMLRVFKENWVNPAYGTPPEPGCWFAKTVGDIDFLFLDTRYFRTNPFAEHPTMLGPVQQAWLLDKLSHSKATFKVIVSSVPWAIGSKPGSHDTWDGFPEQREEIFSSIAANRINGVLLMSADRHRSDVRKIERPDGYALYDMMSSKLTNTHTHACIEGAIFCYNAECSFGMLTIDTAVADPIATYEVVNIDGERLHALQLSLRELSFSH